MTLSNHLVMKAASIGSGHWPRESLAAGGSLNARPWMPPVLWGLFIFLLSSIPNPPVPSTLPQWSDKLTHAALYAVFGALIMRSLSATWAPMTRVAVAVAIAASFGAIDEWHQRLIPGRVSDYQDWYADVTGSLAGSFLAFAGLRREFRS